MASNKATVATPSGFGKGKSVGGASPKTTIPAPNVLATDAANKGRRLRGAKQVHYGEKPPSIKTNSDPSKNPR